MEFYPRPKARKAPVWLGETVGERLSVEEGRQPFQREGLQKLELNERMLQLDVSE